MRENEHDHDVERDHGQVHDSLVLDLVLVRHYGGMTSWFALTH